MFSANRLWSQFSFFVTLWKNSNLKFRKFFFSDLTKIFAINLGQKANFICYFSRQIIIIYQNAVFYFKNLIYGNRLFYRTSEMTLNHLSVMFASASKFPVMSLVWYALIGVAIAVTSAADGDVFDWVVITSSNCFVILHYSHQMTEKCFCLLKSKANVWSLFNHLIKSMYTEGTPLKISVSLLYPRIFRICFANIAFLSIS